jgi:hypothetical protein
LSTPQLPTITQTLPRRRNGSPSNADFSAETSEAFRILESPEQQTFRILNQQVNHQTFENPHQEFGTHEALIQQPIQTIQQQTVRTPQPQFQHQTKKAEFQFHQPIRAPEQKVKEAVTKSFTQIRTVDPEMIQPTRSRSRSRARLPSPPSSSSSPVLTIQDDDGEETEAVRRAKLRGLTIERMPDEGVDDSRERLRAKIESLQHKNKNRKRGRRQQ